MADSTRAETLTPEQIREKIAKILSFVKIEPTEEQVEMGAVTVWQFRRPESDSLPQYGALSMDAYELPHFESDPHALGWLIEYLEKNDVTFTLDRIGQIGKYPGWMSDWLIPGHGWHGTPKRQPSLSMTLCLAIIAYAEAQEEQDND
jgi:hypothetical protein